MIRKRSDVPLIFTTVFACQLYGRTHDIWSDGYGYALPSTEQAMVEVHAQLEDAVGRTRGLFLDRLHYWNRLYIVPGRGRLGHATPLRPLYSTGLSDGEASKGAYGLPTQCAPIK